MTRHKNLLILFFCSMCISVAGQPCAVKSLVPDTPSKAPDYFCTWNLQGYVVSYKSTELTRAAMTEDYLFGDGPYQNWVNCYPAIRKDLYFVMDDSWDIPKGVNDSPNPYLGTVELSPDRFPSFGGDDVERLRQLSLKIKSKGWKGIGGWICAQKAEKYADIPEEEYWKRRIKVANEAGFDYWKVDWGKEDRNGEWRRRLTSMGKRYAPHLYIEHALRNEFIEFSDVFRTYDVENIMAQPITIQRICDLLPYKTVNGAKGIINCEDEPYIAVGLGCAIGVMRHSFAGTLPDGTQDFVFPPTGRDIKRRLDEVVRGVRWHRIAVPFSVGNTAYAIDSVKLTDHWTLWENETWNKGRKVGTDVIAVAPARVARGMGLPEVSGAPLEVRPFVLASRYPNGAVAVVTIGRNLGREYVTEEVAVTVSIDRWDVPVGLLGYFKEVTMVFPSSIEKENRTVYAQDLAGETPVDITSKIVIKGNRLTIPGDVIRQIGLMNASEGDCSDPGMVLRIM